MQIKMTIGCHYLHADSNFKMDTVIKEKAKGAREGEEQLGLSYTAGGEADGHSCSQSCFVVSDKVEQTFTMWLSNPILGKVTKQNKNLC